LIQTTAMLQSYCIDKCW